MNDLLLVEGKCACCFLLRFSGLNSDSYFNLFLLNVPFLYLLKMSENQRFIEKTKGFLTISGGVKMGHWAKMG